MKHLIVGIILLLSLTTEGQTTKDLFSLPKQAFVINGEDDIGTPFELTYSYRRDTIDGTDTLLEYEFWCNTYEYLQVIEDKVFQVQWDGERRLLCDFGAAIGDTVYQEVFNTEYIVIEKKDTVLTDGFSRRLLMIETIIGGRKAKWLEGVGDVNPP